MSFVIFFSYLLNSWIRGIIIILHLYFSIYTLNVLIFILGYFDMLLIQHGLLGANYTPATLLCPGVSKNRHEFFPHLTASQVGETDINQ